MGFGQRKSLQCPSLSRVSQFGCLPASVLRLKLHISIFEVWPARGETNRSIIVSQAVTVNENLFYGR
jgi:hypothetical protein